MRFPVFLAGMAIAVITLAAYGFMKGVSTVPLILMILGTLVIAQFLYIALIAILVRQEKQRGNVDAAAPAARNGRPEKKSDLHGLGSFPSREL